jgi:hypothetical protein
VNLYLLRVLVVPEEGLKVLPAWNTYPINRSSSIVTKINKLTVESAELAERRLDNIEQTVGLAITPYRALYVG